MKITMQEALAQATAALGDTARVGTMVTVGSDLVNRLAWVVMSDKGYSMAATFGEALHLATVHTKKLREQDQQQQQPTNLEVN